MNLWRYSAGTRSGHTLVEMVVVGTILALVGTFATQAWQPIGGSIIGLRDRAVAASELRLAAEFLCQDFGGAEKVDEHKGQLRIRREPDVVRVMGGDWQRGDPGVRYFLEKSKLVRKDLLTDEEFIVARAIVGFRIKRYGANQLRVSLAAGEGADLRTVTLAWSGS